MRTFQSEPVILLAQQIEELGVAERLDGIQPLFNDLSVVLNEALDELRDSLAHNREDPVGESGESSVSIFDD